MPEHIVFGLKSSEIVYLCVLICIPFIIAQECFFCVSILFVCVYVANYVYKKKTARSIDVIGQGIFITGCDSGFGFGLAKRLDSMGFTVFAGCLQENSDGANTLKSSTTGRLHVIQLDVTKDKSVEEAVKFVKKTDLKTHCGLWAVVNNAGIQVVGEVEFCTMDIYHKVAEVNMFGMVRMTKAFLPLIRKTKGRIINVTSVKGRLSVPFNAAYNITKFGGETFSDILRLEMRKFGVKVIIVEPSHFAGITGILNPQNLSRLQKEIESMWNDADEEVRNTYGREYYDVLCKVLEECKPEGCPTVDPVTEAFVDAITAFNPQYRYLIKGGSGWFDVYYVLALLSSYLPTSVMDYLSDRSFLGGMPKIRALQK